MATERATHSNVDRGYTVRQIEGATYPLPPRTDEELAATRVAHPEQVWFWARAFYDSERAAEARRSSEDQAPIQYSTEEFLAFLGTHDIFD
jgi:hypothetical protein